MLVIAHGPDSALALQNAARFLQEQDPDQLGTSFFDAADSSLADIVTAASSIGFFGARRYIVVRELLAKAGYGKNTASGDQSAGKAKSTLDPGPLFAAATGDNVVLLIEPTLASVPAAIRKIVPDDTKVLPGEPPRGRDLLDWVQRTVRGLESTISPRTATLLLDMLYPQSWKAKPEAARLAWDRPPDTAQLTRFLETLALFAHPESIEERHVRELIPAEQDDKLFDFLGAASAGDLGTAAREAEKLLLAGEEPAKLAAQLHGQLELGVLASLGQNRDPETIGREIGLTNPRQMIGVARSRRGIDARTGRAQLLAVLEDDRRLKTGKLRQPLDLLMAMVTDLADTAKPG